MFKREIVTTNIDRNKSEKMRAIVMILKLSDKNIMNLSSVEGNLFEISKKLNNANINIDIGTLKEALTSIRRKKWKPDENELKEIEKELNNAFEAETKLDLEGRPRTLEKPNPVFIKECAKVAVFLMDDEAVFDQLQRLDALVKKKIDSSSSVTLTVSILTKIFEEELEKLGFHKHLGKTLDFVKPKDFRATLRHGLLLKDVALGNKGHREFPHIIQWILIGWQQQDNPFLSMPVINIFKQLGDETSVYVREYENGELTEKNLWDMMVDSYYDTDFRDPGNLSNFLEKPSSKLLYLPNLITIRTKKRDTEAPTVKDEKRIIREKYGESADSTILFKRKGNKPPYYRGPFGENLLIPATLQIDSHNKDLSSDFHIDKKHTF